MSGCHNPTKLVKAKEDMMIDGIEVKQGDDLLMKMPCTCKCHVSQIIHCDYCMYSVGAQMIAEMQKKEETITIKKALWDEMLEYKSKIDALIHEVFSTQLNRIDDLCEFKDIYEMKTNILEKQITENALALLGIQKFIDYFNQNCKAFNEILELESTLNELVDQVKEMARVISYNEQSLIESCRDIKDVKSDCDTHCGAIVCLERKVEALEKHKHSQIDENRAVSKTFDQLLERIIELERFQEITHLEYKHNRKGKIPQICRICEGRKNHIRYIINNAGESISTQEICIACNGEGIEHI